MGAKLLRGFSSVWCCFTFGIVFASCVSIWFADGFGKMQEIFSPFNVVNYVATIIMLSPAIGARMLAGKLDRRARDA